MDQLVRTVWPLPGVPAVLLETGEQFSLASRLPPWCGLQVLPLSMLGGIYWPGKQSAVF